MEQYSSVILLYMVRNKKNTVIIGSLGEKLAQKYLNDSGFRIIDLNYTKKWGEIDLIAKKGEKIHFIEVKTVSYETKKDLESALKYRSWRPEEQVTARKLHQIKKVVQSWIGETVYEGEFCIDVLALRIVPHETYVTVNFIENILIE